MSDKDSNNSNNNKKPKEFKFSEDEFNLLNETNKELKHDNENFDDLKTLPENKPDMPAKELDKLIKDPNIKTTVTKPGETPPLTNTLSSMDRMGEVKDDDIKAIKDKNQKERQNLVILLADAHSIHLDIKVGTKDGHSVFRSKEYFYNAISKNEEFQIKMKQSRLSTIGHRYTGLTAGRRASTWTDEEFEFVQLAPAMMEVAAYQLGEFEAFLRLGMSSDDYARVEVEQYKLAIEVMSERISNPYSSRRGR